MRIDGTDWRTIWRRADGSVAIIDQTRLPFALEVVTLATAAEAARAIAGMQVRGAPLIGAAAAYGMALAAAADPSDAALAAAAGVLMAARPTAVNLAWAVEAQLSALRPLAPDARAAAAFARADAIAEDDVARNTALGMHGLALVRAAAEARPGPVQILTHCNAGWLATVDRGTATAPIYAAAEAGIDLHVWVDETRPRNQGGQLTAWELARAGIPHTVIVDNAGGHLMQAGQVDLCLVGTDRTARNGDVANKIGTYLKALAARDCGVPFHVCLPSPTIDWQIAAGAAIPIEERAAAEVETVAGPEGPVRVVSPGSPVANPAFDVTPARLVTSLVTERGICAASPEGLAGLFPEHAAPAARSA
ncbi:S-methyl-5-thioribose-1-phosphate isomerase, partial [Paralimibaculum aggregatum]|uniref:S-methyl-5-thioribose-1-phosphate isomerase n=1 Tax=Paralimibaculum aggregatum TaxID=3036245 RepID=UPI002555E4E6